ncbi:hypothetical protein HDU79_003017 [Rhizoclosmatium sp. JEL0117]|nr:hypothetical protein HDU79_003017 [Rhizoclosmatium sp. JEL0117]
MLWLIYANQGFFEKAIADHKKALVIEPTHQNAHRYLQKCIVRKKELDDETRSAETGNFLMPLDETPDRRRKILLTKELMYSDGTVEPHPPKNPPPPPHALSAVQRNYSTSSLGSSTEAITQKPEEYGFVFDDVEDTVAPPPDSSSSSRKRKKEKKSSKEKKKRKKEKKEKKKSSSKKRRRRDSDSDDSNSETESDTE